ncbi:PiggyBac transposable element-derived protein 3 [Lucilia cuprina]|nr:PiggyBac transposable element-derived protein 3 [Lucilia cuprina]
MNKHSGSKRALTKYELEAIFDSWSDEEAELDKICIIPPNKANENTDKENFDDDLILHGDIRPLYEIINKKFMQFGIWEDDLSVDEQMVPYFGRHSCKMFIRGKPIRFGYKLWCLCSANGYLYDCIPLHTDVVLRLLENIEFADRHTVYFDNFFTSYYLMCLQTEIRLCATGTVRANRIRGAVLKTGKGLERSDHDFQFDSNNKILICRWQDNKEVTVATNFDQLYPTLPVKKMEKK